MLKTNPFVQNINIGFYNNNKNWMNGLASPKASFRIWDCCGMPPISHKTSYFEWEFWRLKSLASREFWWWKVSPRPEFHASHGAPPRRMTLKGRRKKSGLANRESGLSVASPPVLPSLFRLFSMYNVYYLYTCIFKDCFLINLYICLIVSKFIHLTCLTVYVTQLKTHNRTVMSTAKLLL